MRIILYAVIHLPAEGVLVPAEIADSQAVVAGQQELPVRLQQIMDTAQDRRRIMGILNDICRNNNVVIPILQSDTCCFLI